MAQMIVIYKLPKNPAGFDRHYFEVHAQPRDESGSDHLPLWSQRRSLGGDPAL
jgi:hypothetical protein